MKVRNLDLESRGVKRQGEEYYVSSHFADMMNQTHHDFIGLYGRGDGMRLTWTRGRYDAGESAKMVFYHPKDLFYGGFETHLS